MSTIESSTFEAASQQPLVCGYVITYNGKRFLERCLRTLEQLTDYENFQMILVDNGSSDGSGAYARENFPEVEVLRVFPNAGYSHAANEAVADGRRRGAKYVVLMNDDIAILHPQWLREAVSHAERDARIGLIGFAEISSEDAPQPEPESKLTDVQYLGSAVVFVPTVMFDRIGIFDEIYLTGGDESELGIRAQAAGYRAVTLGIPNYHFGGGTIKTLSRRMAYLDMRNGIRFCLKNHGPVRALLRTVRSLDVACNPWPLTLDDRFPAIERMRNSGNLAINFLLWLGAVAWNVVWLPQTLRIRAREQALIRAARADWGQLTAPANNRAWQRRASNNAAVELAEMGDRT